jgi:hypothetical protein
MAIYKLIANGSFGPEEIKIMTEAYEEALIDLAIDRNDPLTELIAKAVVHRGALLWASGQELISGY